MLDAAIHVRFMPALGISDISREFIYRVPVSFPGAGEQVPGGSAESNCLFYHDSCLRYNWDYKQG